MVGFFHVIPFVVKMTLQCFDNYAVQRGIRVGRLF